MPTNTTEVYELNSKLTLFADANNHLTLMTDEHLLVITTEQAIKLRDFLDRWVQNHAN